MYYNSIKTFKLLPSIFKEVIIMIKKALCAAITAAMILSIAACSPKSTDSGTSVSQESIPESTTQSESVSETAESSSGEESTASSDTEESDFKLSEEVTKKIDDIITENEMEGVLYITKDNKPIYKSETGKVDDKEDITVNTPLPIGSISKQFCAVSILQLRDAGKLSLDDTLDKYFPDYEKGKDITLMQAMTMRSGIPDIEGVVFDFKEGATDEENTLVVLKWLYEQELGFTPGTHFQYSNTNFFLLANIVEKVSQQSYTDYLHENIFTPLNMTQSGSIYELKDSPQWANGLTYSDVAEQKYAGFAKGAGDLVCSASDLSSWITNLKSGKVISTDSYNEMTSNHSDDPENYYGYGIQFDMYGGIGHLGAINPYCSAEYTNPETSLTVIAISNIINPNDIGYVCQDTVKALSE